MKVICHLYDMQTINANAPFQVLKADEVKEKTAALNNGEVCLLSCSFQRCAETSAVLIVTMLLFRSWSLRTSGSTKRRPRMTQDLQRR